MASMESPIETPLTAPFDTLALSRAVVHSFRLSFQSSSFIRFSLRVANFSETVSLSRQELEGEYSSVRNRRQRSVAGERRGNQYPGFLVGRTSPKPATSGRRRRLRLAQHKVHYPAAPDVDTWLAAVVQDVLIIAASVFEGVGED